MKPPFLRVKIGGVVSHVEEPLVGRAIRVAAELGHGDHAGHVRSAGAEFVRDRTVRQHGVEGRILASGIRHRREAAALYDELRSSAVNDRVVIDMICDVAKKVGDGLRCLIVEQADLHVINVLAAGVRYAPAEIEIAAVVVWRVRDTLQASFDVEKYEEYVCIQSESAVRHLANCPLMTSRKSFLLRISPALYEALESWASKNCVA